MKSISRLVVVLALLAVNVSWAGMMETVPTGEEVYRWVYEYLDELYARGLISDLHVGTRPYFRGKVAHELRSLRGKIDEGMLSLAWPEEYLLEELEKEFSGEISQLMSGETSADGGQIRKTFSWGLDFEEGSSFKASEKAAFRETFCPYVKAQIGPNFFACTRYTLDESLAKDSDYDGKVWRGFAGDAAQAYLAFNLPYLKMLLGRERVAWGQKPAGGLILSENAFPLDMLKIQGGWGVFQVSSFIAFLSSIQKADSSGEIARENRYISGHRISLNLFSKIQLGLSETVIYGGEDRQVEAYYLNPLLWYHGAQMNEKRDDNTFFAFDFNLRPKRDVLLYGEFLIDDLQIEKKSQGDKEPNELAYFGGLSVLDPFGLRATEINAEYMRINNWTYNQVEERNRYLNRNRLLGNPLGPDTDRIRLSFSRWLRRGLKSTLSYQKTRSGEGSVNSPWSQPWMTAQGEYKEKFPSGVVETEDNFGLTLQYRYSNALSCKLMWDYLAFANYQNIENREEDYNQVSLNLSYHFQGVLY
ncbi:MAG: hypothetical protein JSV10_09265 [Candidatus Zixiibacteriota bacterium]|nr:MAG: hypothetical protein JSV10_09265 [candidate division Zixibacteria bacterium]